MKNAIISRVEFGRSGQNMWAVNVPIDLQKGDVFFAHLTDDLVKVPDGDDTVYYRYTIDGSQYRVYDDGSVRRSFLAVYEVTQK